VALGAARQAAWVLSRASDPAAELPTWAAASSQTYEAPAQPQVRERYAALRDDAAAWQL
jgi:xylulokinase